MKLIIFLITTILTQSYLYANTNNTKRLFNNGEPIVLNINASHEVRLDFDFVIAEVGVKQQIQPKLYFESIDSRLWLKSSAEFKQTKMLVKDEKGKLIVFLLTSNKTQNNNLINVYKVITAKQIKPLSPKIDTNNKLSIVDLTRFAAQYFYAPKRLIQDIGLFKVPFENLKHNIFSCSSASLLCLNTKVKVVASWSNSNYYISAIEVKNISQDYLTLDPRLLNGNFVAATFQFNRLSPKNTNLDTTMLYLITNTSLEQAL